MSDDATNPSEDAEETPSRNASLKVETSSLNQDERSFAEAMGFGDDPPPPSPTPASASRPLVSQDAQQDHTSTEAAAAESKSQENKASDEWEEVHSRPASEGIQATLQARAQEVLEREAEPEPDPDIQPRPVIAPPTDVGALAALRAELVIAQNALAVSQQKLAARDAELSAASQTVRPDSGLPSERENENEKLSQEFETLSIEHDQLVDQLAATSGRLVQSEARTEKLEASLRAARGALTPLPDGERALRAEVIGLRGRLEETRQENLRIASEFASVATELAIAAARVEDRQYEIDYHVDRAEAFECAARENHDELESATARHRETLALAARVQAENTELRSTQEALEETLQARDLEIAAREEHLRVTRAGLSSRDQQLVDSNERLELQRRNTVGLEADLERAGIEREQLLGRVARRESRIATLTETLTRIDDAMGNTLVRPVTGSPFPPQKESTHSNGTAQARAELPASPPAQSQEVSADLPNAESPDDSDLAPDAILVAAQPLPAVLTNWRDRRFAELFEASDSPSVADFFAARLHASFDGNLPDSIHLRSLGGSLPDAEVRLVLALQQKGFEGIRLEVVDAGSKQAEARRHRVELAGLGDVIDVSIGDLDVWNLGGSCHAILLADALHSQPNLGSTSITSRRSSRKAHFCSSPDASEPVQ